MEKKKLKNCIKTAQTKGTRDKFGSLLYLSTKSKLISTRYLSIQPNQEPPCFAYLDRNIRDSPKSKVQPFQKEHVHSHLPSDVVAAVVDDIFLLDQILQYLLSTKSLPEIC